MLRLITSNRYEKLEARLLEALHVAPPHPFVPQQVIIPSTGIKRAIELRLALNQGICTQIHFNYLAQWLWQQIAKVIKVSDRSPFSPDLLVWRIFSIFDNTDLLGNHPRLERYLQSADDFMRFELARRCAGLFDQYLTYRPDWLKQWLEPSEQRDGDEAWQAALWQHIAAQLGADSHHPSLRFFSALRNLTQSEIDRSGLGGSVQIFCLPSIPKLYLEMLRELSQWMEINIYAINPCAEYWFEIVNPKRLSELRLRSLERRSGNDLYQEIGHRLLASWGQQSKEHLAALMDHDSELIEVQDFEVLKPTTLLTVIQGSIFQMLDLEPGSCKPHPSDRSLEIHVCHSLTRELEVLKDQLLALFSGTNPPSPSEVLVVFPDLEAASPLIEAVFGQTASSISIPYQITGGPARSLNPCAKTLLKLLDFANSRFTADRFIALLGLPGLARRFGFEHEDIMLIQKWFDEAGIRWGIDAKHRERLGVPGFDTYSFLDGLDRLFLAYAMPAADMTPIGRKMAASHVQGQEALTLGRLKCLLDALRSLHHALVEAKSPKAWHQWLLATIETFFQSDHQTIDALSETKEAIHAMYSDLMAAEFRKPLSYAVIHAALESSLESPLRGAVPTGAVTFASISSLRTLPYRFIAVLGLSDEAFPSKRRPLEFDLMALNPRPGDRQRQVDDRGIFLDLLLAARDRFYISYTGRSIRDHASLAPSVLISDLLDYAALASADEPTSAESIAKARYRLIIEHPLQAFSPDYFQTPIDPRKHSFDRLYRDAHAQRLKLGQRPPNLKPFFSKPLAEPDETFRRLSLDNLIDFFLNPCRYLLKHRLGIVLRQARLPLKNEEPFQAEARHRQYFGDLLLPALLKSESNHKLAELVQACPGFPPGPIGASAREREFGIVEDFANHLKALHDSPLIDRFSETIDVPLDEDLWQIDFSCSDLRSHGWVKFRYAETQPRDYLRGWIEHLALNAVKHDHGADRRLRWLSRDGSFELAPIDDAFEQLQNLLRLYRQGLRTPLHFFPRSAWAFVSKAMSFEAAEAVWYPDRFTGLGESLDPAYELALRGEVEVIDEAFASNAKVVLSPLLAALHDERVASKQ